MPNARTLALREAFLEHLAESGNVSEAAALAGTSRSLMYRQARVSDNFRAAWGDALEAAVETLRAEAYTRAIDGVGRPHRGQLLRDETGTPIETRDYSDRLLIHLLDEQMETARSRTEWLMGDWVRRRRTREERAKRMEQREREG